MATVFSVRASAGKGSFSVSLVSEQPLVLKVEIPAEPEKGRANRELVFRLLQLRCRIVERLRVPQLEELLGCSVQILSGKTGRRKTLAADCTKDEMMQKINNKNER